MPRWPITGLERLSVPVVLDVEDCPLSGAAMRYQLMERVAACCRRRSAHLVAFGISSGQLRLVLEGESAAIRSVILGIKVGTNMVLRRWNQRVQWGCTDRRTLLPADLERAVIWCHELPLIAGAVLPLASPWSSHRDLMGYRCSAWFDGVALRGRVDARRVHEHMGGGPLPVAGVAHARSRDSLSILLRFAGAMFGVLPANHRCFRMFIHLGKSQGWKNTQLATALALTSRRVRQLASSPEPLLEMAMAALEDHRLRCVP